MPATNFPGLSVAMSQEVINVAKGNMNPLSSDYVYRRQHFHNRLTYAAAGAAQFKFFTADPGNVHVGNMRSAGLPNETFAWVHGLRIKIETGLDIAGALVANAGQLNAQATPTLATSTTMLAEAVRNALETGIVNLTFGDKKIIEDMHGLYNFPSGGGPQVNSSACNNNATTSHTAAVINNGDPFVANIFEFTPGQLLLPQKKVQLVLDYIAAVALPAAAVIKADLVCTYVTPSNN